jgi:hypothetical protein
MPVNYLDPSAETATPQEPYLARLDERCNPRIALFANLFADSKEFLLDLASPLGRLLSGSTYPYFDKQYGRYMSTAATPELRARIIEASDAVVLAYGHCGSCTSGVVHDAVLLAQQGRAVATMVTARFRDEALFLAQALGQPELPFVFLPHPVAGQATQWQRELGERIAPAVVKALKTGASTDATDVMTARTTVATA